MLGVAVILYVLISPILGVYFLRTIYTDKKSITNSSFPLRISTITVFATWFGAESLLYLPAGYANSGIIGIVSDPIGAFLCLVVIGVIFGRTFYNLNVMTIADFLRKKYGKAVEVTLGMAIVCSYLGWMTAQFLAFGFMVSFLCNDIISQSAVIVTTTVVIGIYAYRGGVKYMAANDFMQTVVIVFGLLFVMLNASGVIGGFGEILKHVHSNDQAAVDDSAYYPNLYSVAGVIFAMILGTIPQQNIFTPVTSSPKNMRTSLRSTLFGGLVYLLVTLIPIFIIIAASKINFQAPKEHGNLELFLVSFIVEYTPFPIQVLFFWGVLSGDFIYPCKYHNSCWGDI